MCADEVRATSRRCARSRSVWSGSWPSRAIRRARRPAGARLRRLLVEPPHHPRQRHGRVRLLTSDPDQGDLRCSISVLRARSSPTSSSTPRPTSGSPRARPATSRSAGRPSSPTSPTSRTGWLRFREGQAPERVIDPSLERAAPCPGEGFKRGFVLAVYSQKFFGGLAELSSASIHMGNAIRELYADFERERAQPSWPGPGDRLHRLRADEGPLRGQLQAPSRAGEVGRSAGRAARCQPGRAVRDLAGRAGDDSPAAGHPRAAAASRRRPKTSLGPSSDSGTVQASQELDRERQRPSDRRAGCRTDAAPRAASVRRRPRRLPRGQDRAGLDRRP